MRINRRQTTAPRYEPIHLTEAKNWLRVEHTDDDALITALIAAVRDHVEGWTSRQLVTATWTLTMEDFPEAIMLPVSPALAVSSITYVDSGGTTDTVTSTVYDLQTEEDPPRIIETYNQSWPGDCRSEPNDVTVTYTAGYATPFTVEDLADWTGTGTSSGTGTETGYEFNEVTFLGRVPVDGEKVRVWNSGGALPTGLSTFTDYYVRSVSGYTCRFATSSGGAVVNMTTAGTGYHYAGLIPEPIRAATQLMLGDLYENRQAVVNAAYIPKENPTTARLLWPYRIVEV